MASSANSAFVTIGYRLNTNAPRYPQTPLQIAHSNATNITVKALLNPNITIKPAMGVAVPVALLTKPNNAIMIPEIAPPTKFVT